MTAKTATAAETADDGEDADGDHDDPHDARRPEGGQRLGVAVALKVPPTLHVCSHIRTKFTCQHPEATLAARGVSTGPQPAMRWMKCGKAR